MGEDICLCYIQMDRLPRRGPRVASSVKVSNGVAVLTRSLKIHMASCLEKDTSVTLGN